MLRILPHIRFMNILFIAYGTHQCDINQDQLKDSSTKFDDTSNTEWAYKDINFAYKVRLHAIKEIKELKDREKAKHLKKEVRLT